MKKTIILIAITVTLGIQNPAMGFVNSGVVDLSKPGANWWSLLWGTSNNNPPKDPPKDPAIEKVALLQEKAPPFPISSFIAVLNRQLDETKKQLKETGKIYQSITGSRRSDIIPRINIGVDYFQNPKSIYDKSGFKSSSLNDDTDSKKTKMEDIIINQDLSLLSVSDARQFIEERSQYAAIVDKAVSLQVFGEIKNRFRNIQNVFSMIAAPLDLKAIIELQSYMEGTLSIFQNEAIKLQT
ncbi:type IV secretion system protein, partial [Bartonella queenslandensis]|uniref:type IV secretion system protein n=1 Tax=Bartonella queenslandensis TaxID=481138 RepID=UPI00058472BE